jgi:hypothetical protein
MSVQQEFIQSLIQQETKLSLEEFFKTIHEKFYSTQNISFMEYFLELTNHEGEFIVHHEKLIEYGIVTSIKSSNIKEKLDALGLVENEEYHLLDIQQVVRSQGGGTAKKVYTLTPEAFKTCLMRARKYPNQTVDPVVYSKYYLLLEKIHKLYTDYEKQLLNKQIEQKDQVIEQKDQVIEQKDQVIEQKDQVIEQNQHQLEEERQYRLGLEEGLLTNTTPLEFTQIIYIATSINYAKQNRFKIGGVGTIDNLEGRLATYNTGRANGDDLFYVEWYNVVCYKDIEKRLETLIGRFKDRKAKEIYVLHYNNLKYIIEYIITHYNEEAETINQKLEEFIKNLNIRKLRPVVVQPKPLNRIQIQRVGQPDVVITSNTTESLIDRIESYITTLNTNTQIVNAKQVFDSLEIKSGRRGLYPTLKDVMERLLPNAKMIKV